MLRIGVLGAGRHSTREHGPALAHCRDEGSADVELAAVCDRDEPRAREYADRFGFASTFDSLDGMLDAERLDGVVAVTPVEHTSDLAGELLEQGIPTLVEKPPGATLEAAAELREVAARTGTPHMVSLNRRFNPAVARAREWLATEDRAPPTHATSELLRVERFEDGFLRNTGIHAVDTVCSFLGAPVSVSAQRWQSRDGTSGGDCAAALVDFVGATAQFTLAPDAGRHAETCDLSGPGYTVEIDVAGVSATLSVDGETVSEWCLPADAPGYIRSGALGETRAFLDALQSDAPFAPTVAEASRSLALADAIDAGDDRSFEHSDLPEP